jgi:hypothetical protein
MNHQNNNTTRDLREKKSCFFESQANIYKVTSPASFRTYI